MNCFQSWRAVAVLSVAFGAASFGLLSQNSLPADDEKDKAPQEKAREDDALAKQRLTLMQERVAAFGVTSRDDAGIPERFEDKPVFRYSDPARGIVGAALWRLGAKGRPKALISTELMPKLFGRPRIVYEFLSLTEIPFNAASRDYRWEPTSSALTMKPLPKSPPPAAGASARIRQLKQLAKRFTASELVDGERCELRLMPTPIERYTPADADRADATIFLFSFGTNPEALLFIETDGTDWTYGFARLSGAASMTAMLDEMPAWEVGPSPPGINSNYVASNAPEVIPGVDP
jgi:hypothetical protein